MHCKWRWKWKKETETDSDCVLAESASGLEVLFSWKPQHKPTADVILMDADSVPQISVTFLYCPDSFMDWMDSDLVSDLWVAARQSHTDGISRKWSFLSAAALPLIGPIVTQRILSQKKKRIASRMAMKSQSPHSWWSKISLQTLW